MLYNVLLLPDADLIPDSCLTSRLLQDGHFGSLLCELSLAPSLCLYLDRDSPEVYRLRPSLQSCVPPAQVPWVDRRHQGLSVSATVS